MFKYFILTGLMVSFLISNNENIREDAMLFCLKSHIPVLEISRDNDKISIKNHIKINQIINSFIIKDIEKWLLNATEQDFNNNIYLNRIYRIQLKGNDKSILDLIKNQLDALDDIYLTEYEYIRKPVFTPNDNQYSQQWFLPHVNADNAWDYWDISEGEIPGDLSILLASVDTGVDWNHPDLSNNIWNNLGEDIDGDGKTIIEQGGEWIFDPDDVNFIDDDGNGYIDDFIGWDCSGYSGSLSDNDNNPSPPPGVSNGGTWAHGTHVAGLLSASTNNNLGIASVAYNCSIMCVKVSSGDQDYPYITHGYDGILYAAKAGFTTGDFTIINNSWGGISYSEFEQATINVAHDTYNAVILAAGGNGDDTGIGTDEFAHFPSSYDNVISVCPTGVDDTWNHWATYHETIDIAAPGEGIKSTKIGSGYVSWSGSSMATPIVGSVIGLMRSMHPTWNNDQLISMVLGTSNPIIYDVNTEDYLIDKLGEGRVDALSAISTELFPKLEFIDFDLFIFDDINGVIEQGETIELRTILFNNPEWGIGYGIVGELLLSEGMEDINILSNIANFGDAFPGDAVMNETDPFLIYFGSNSPVGEVELQLKITSNIDGYIRNEQSLTVYLNVVEESILIGDLNNDGEINILDIVQIVNIILGQIPTDYQSEAGDFNQDDTINVLDIVNIVNHILDI